MQDTKWWKKLLVVILLSVSANSGVGNDPINDFKTSELDIAISAQDSLEAELCKMNRDQEIVRDLNDWLENPDPLTIYLLDDLPQLNDQSLRTTIASYTQSFIDQVTLNCDFQEKSEFETDVEYNNRIRNANHELRRLSGFCLTQIDEVALKGGALFQRKRDAIESQMALIINKHYALDENLFKVAIEDYDLTRFGFPISVDAGNIGQYRAFLKISKPTAQIVRAVEDRLIFKSFAILIVLPGELRGRCISGFGPFVPRIDHIYIEDIDGVLVGLEPIVITHLELTNIDKRMSIDYRRSTMDDNSLSENICIMGTDYKPYEVDYTFSKTSGYHRDRRDTRWSYRWIRSEHNLSVNGKRIWDSVSEVIQYSHKSSSEVRHVRGSNPEQIEWIPGWTFERYLKNNGDGHYIIVKYDGP